MDWFPFRNRIAFETADFLFKRRKMSIADINFLFRLWGATLAPYNDVPPFVDHRELYDTIDMIPVGGVPWQSASLSYDGPLPDDAPTWMENEFIIWFQDPHLLVKNMIANPDFLNNFDYAPLRQYDSTGSRCYENFMSGDWAWRQAVRIA